MHIRTSTVASAFLVTVVASCGGASPARDLQIFGESIDQPGAMSIVGAAPSRTNGTDFGNWNTGTMGNPAPLRSQRYEVRNEGGAAVPLPTGPRVEVVNADGPRFAVFEDLIGASLEPGAHLSFSISFDGGGADGTHRATVLIHVPGLESGFAIEGTTTPISIH